MILPETLRKAYETDPLVHFGLNSGVTYEQIIADMAERHRKLVQVAELPPVIWHAMPRDLHNVD